MKEGHTIFNMGKMPSKGQDGTLVEYNCFQFQDLQDYSNVSMFNFLKELIEKKGLKKEICHNSEIF